MYMYGATKLIRRIFQIVKPSKTYEITFDKDGVIDEVCCIEQLTAAHPVVKKILKSEKLFLEKKPVLGFDYVKQGEAMSNSGVPEPNKIVAAAIKRGEEIITGRRHADCIKEAIEVRGWAPPITQAEQGFVSTSGDFWDRRQACILAAQAGQLKEGVKPKGLLISEDIW